MANIGDSRAIIARRQGEGLVAHALSSDQTPYRKDERERIRKCGGVITNNKFMSEGRPPPKEPDDPEQWAKALGEEPDDKMGVSHTDPPRVFQPSGGGGCAFTRSLGDASSESCGVSAEAEIVTMQLSTVDAYLILASDGVWEFMTNEEVIETVGMSTGEPVDACRDVVAIAYMLWLQFDVRTDDITIILAYIDNDGSFDGAESPDPVSSTQPPPARLPPPHRPAAMRMDQLEKQLGSQRPATSREEEVAAAQDTA